MTKMTKDLGRILLAAILISIFFITQQYLLPYYYASTIQQRILKQYPLMVLISLKSPVEFKEYIDKVKANIMKRGDKTNEYYYSANLINTEFSKYAAKASNESLYRFLGSEIRLYKGLYRRNPSYILYIEFPQKFRASFNLENLNKALSIKDVKALEKAKEAVITSGLDNKSIMAFSDAQQSQASSTLNQIISSLNKQYGHNLVFNSLTTPDKAELSQKLTAEIIISYYERIYAEGPQRAGDILRIIFATHTATAAR